MTVNHHSPLQLPSSFFISPIFTLIPKSNPASAEDGGKLLEEGMKTTGQINGGMTEINGKIENGQNHKGDGFICNEQGEMA